MPAQPGPAILAAAEQHNIAQSKLNAINVNPQEINTYRSPKRGNKITILASDASIRLCIPADDLMPLSENGSVPCIDNMQLSSSQKEWLQGYAKDAGALQPTNGSQQQHIHHDEAVIQQQHNIISSNISYVTQHDLITLPPISRLEHGSLATNHHKDLMKLHRCAQTGTNSVDQLAACDQYQNVHDKLGNPGLGAESSCDETSCKPACSSMKQDGQSSEERRKYISDQEGSNMKVPNNEGEEEEGDEEKSSAAANIINPLLKDSDKYENELFHMKGTIDTSSIVHASHASLINVENQHSDTSIESSMISDVEHLDPLLEELKQLYMIRPSLKNHDHNPADVLSSKAGDEKNHADLKSHDGTPPSTEDEVQSETPSLSSSTAAMAAAAGLEQLLVRNEKNSTRAVTAGETEEEARIRAELEFEIEKDLEREIRTKITLLSRRLDQLHNLQARRHPINNPKESDHFIHDQRQSGAINHDDADQAATLMKQLDLATSPIRATAEITSVQSASKVDNSHRIGTNHFRPSTPQPSRPVLTQSASCNKRMLHHPMNDHLSDKNHVHFSTYDRSHSLKKHSPTLTTGEVCGTPAGLAMDDIRKLASDLISKTSKPGSLKLRTEKAMLKHLQTSLASITTRSKKFDWIRTLRGGNNSASPANPNSYSEINAQTSPTSYSSSQSQTSPFRDDQGCHVQSHAITNSHQSELASNLNSKKLKSHDHRKALLQQAAAITSGDNIHIHHHINHSDHSSHGVPSYSKPTISAAITTAITSQRFKINRHSSTSKAPPAATVAPNSVPHKFQDHDQVRVQSKIIKPEVPPAVIRGIKNPSASGKLNYRSLHTASSKAKEVVIKQQITPASKHKLSSHVLRQQQQSDQNMQVI